MKKTWSDLSTGQRVVVATLATLEFGLAVTAWTDLARRPAAQIRGARGMWAGIIAINFAGPIAYFVRGRVRS